MRELTTKQTKRCVEVLTIIVEKLLLSVDSDHKPPAPGEAWNEARRVGVLYFPICDWRVGHSVNCGHEGSARNVLSSYLLSSIISAYIRSGPL